MVKASDQRWQSWDNITATAGASSDPAFFSIAFGAKVFNMNGSQDEVSSGCCVSLALKMDCRSTANNVRDERHGKSSLFIYIC